MLSHLYIRDFAIIDELDLDLKQGFTTLTGETGAGKSILLDALSLVLGAQAKNHLIRHQAQKAEVVLSIDLAGRPALTQWLQDNELADEAEQCIIRRLIVRDGKSKAWINGVPVNLKSLRALAQMVVEIHGQHEYHQLMQSSKQLALLDAYAEHSQLLQKTQQACQAWRRLVQRWQQLQAQQVQRSERLALLRFQVAELLEHELLEDEYAALDDELSRLSHADQLNKTARHAMDVLYETDASVYGRMSAELKALNDQLAVDANLKTAVDLLAEAQIIVQEAALFLRSYAEGVTSDETRLGWVDARVRSLRELSKKYAVLPDELPSHWQGLQAELDQLLAAESDDAHLQEDIEQARLDYQKRAQALSLSRQKAAQRMSKNIVQSMQELGMEGGTFEVQLTFDADATPHESGSDAIDFQVSANPGVPVQSLTKVASGGELSRISLALQMELAQKSTMPCLVFDEVDSGIGGGVAEVVGRSLHALSRHCQVICVTHLAQVAAFANQHLSVCKDKQKAQTSVNITMLDDAQREEEIARMLGGVDHLTKATLDLAKEMLQK